MYPPLPSLQPECAGYVCVNPYATSHSNQQLPDRDCLWSDHIAVSIVSESGRMLPTLPPYVYVSSHHGGLADSRWLLF